MHNELYHYGIQGQKWGVRRYQNEDGSLTPEGKKRLAKDYSKGIFYDAERRDQLKTVMKSYKKNNEKFNKITNKMERRKVEGKVLRDWDKNRAIKAGTKVRYADKLMKNTDKWLERDSKYQADIDKIGLATLGAHAANGARIAIKNKINPDSISTFDVGIAAAITGAQVIASWKAIKTNELQYGSMKDQQKWADDLYDEAKNETIEDLKKHGLW